MTAKLFKMKFNLFILVISIAITCPFYLAGQNTAGSIPNKIINIEGYKRKPFFGLKTGLILSWLVKNGEEPNRAADGFPTYQPTSDIKYSHKREDEKPLTYSIGIMRVYPLKRRLSFETGLFYSTFRNKIISSSKGYIDDLLISESTGTNSYAGHFLQCPALLRYFIRDQSPKNLCECGSLRSTLDGIFKYLEKINN